MNKFNLIDLSINGIKIDITDISENNFKRNHNKSPLHNSREKNYGKLIKPPTKNMYPFSDYPLYTNSYNNYSRNHTTNTWNNNKTDIKNNTIDDITDFNMKVNKLLEDIRKKQTTERERLEEEREKRRINNNLKYKGFLDTIQEDTDRQNRRAKNSIVYFNKGETSRKDIDRLINDITSNYDKEYMNKRNFNGFLDSSKDNKVSFQEQRKHIDNPLQNAIPQSQIPRPVIKKKFVEIDETVDSLTDLLTMIDKYPMKYDVEYNINMENLHAIKSPLTELNGMIGMDKLKTNIVDQILYFIQDLHNVADKNNQDFMHTVIYGPPGTGKTEIAKIMGNIFSKLGILKKNVFRKATRSDLIAGYLGQTAIKTRDLVTSCLGGVLFIDEAYALGNEEKRDSFAKECIDTLCEALSDHKDEIMVIIAGYEKELKDCFFNYNQGLESRFTWRFHTDNYKPNELMNIFEKKVKDAGWSFSEDDKSVITADWFEERMKYFKYYGRDMETLFAKTKIAHSRRVFCKPKDQKTKINKEDLEKGYKLYFDNDEVKNRGEDDNFSKVHKTMYM